MEIIASHQISRQVVWSLAALAAAAAWVGLTVRYNWNGNVSGLFYTGAGRELPPALAPEDIARAPDGGYDGQFYHLVAHDPFLSRGFTEWADNPRLRWRRVLVPGLAWLAAFGSDDYVDSLYVAVVLLFTGLGAWWLAQWALLHGWPAAVGLAFLFVPAVLVSLDRMTVDVALAALCVAFSVYGEARPSRFVYVVLAAAPLVRETGLVLAAGWCLWNALARRWQEAAMGALCALPALAWWAYVHANTGEDRTPWLAAWPFSGLVERTLHPPFIPPASAWMRAAAMFEWLALAGLWLAIAAALWLLWRKRGGLLEITAALFVLFFAFVGKADVWADAYAAGRTLSPLFLLLALRQPLLAAPMLLVLPRIALQYQPQVKGVLRGLAG